MFVGLHDSGPVAGLVERPEQRSMAGLVHRRPIDCGAGRFDRTMVLAGGAVRRRDELERPHGVGLDAASGRLQPRRLLLWQQEVTALDADRRAQLEDRVVARLVHQQLRTSHRGHGLADVDQHAVGQPIAGRRRLDESGAPASGPARGASAVRNPLTTPRRATGQVGGASIGQTTCASASAGTGRLDSARATRTTRARRPPSAAPETELEPLLTVTSPTTATRGAAPGSVAEVAITRTLRRAGEVAVLVNRRKAAPMRLARPLTIAAAVGLLGLTSACGAAHKADNAAHAAAAIQKAVQSAPPAGSEGPVSGVSLRVANMFSSSRTPGGPLDIYDVPLNNPNATTKPVPIISNVAYGAFSDYVHPHLLGTLTKAIELEALPGGLGPGGQRIAGPGHRRPDRRRLRRAGDHPAGGSERHGHLAARAAGRAERLDDHGEGRRRPGRQGPGRTAGQWRRAPRSWRRTPRPRR